VPINKGFGRSSRVSSRPQRIHNSEYLKCCVGSLNAASGLEIDQ
jgi:hypothetical protein